MSEALVKTEIDYSNREVIDTIKQTVAKGATDAQLAQFLQVCKATGLNPFLREVWCIPATNTIMTSRDGYLRVANDNPNFDGMETKVERDDKGIPIKATCSVWRKDRGRPIVCEAYYSEYRKDSNVWKTYPSAMISKVAEVLALKRSFAINGVVTEEEIGNPERAVAASSVASVLNQCPKGGEHEWIGKDPKLSPQDWLLHCFKCGLENKYVCAPDPQRICDSVPYDKSNDVGPMHPLPAKYDKLPIMTAQLFNTAEFTKNRLKFVLSEIHRKSPNFTEVEYFRDLMEKNKCELHHIDDAHTDSQIKALEKALEKAEILLKEKEEAK